MKGDMELEMLLKEIPHVTSHNMHQNHMHQQHFNAYFQGGNGNGNDTGSFATPTRTAHGAYGAYGAYGDEQSSYCKYSCSSPVSGFSLRSDGSSSSLFSNGQSVFDKGSPTPSPLEDLHSYISSGNPQNPDRLWLDCRVSDSLIRNKANDNLIDELSLSRNLSKMYITSEQKNGSSFGDFRDQFRDQIKVDKHGASANLNKGYPDHVTIQSPVRRPTMNFDSETSQVFRGYQESRVNNSVDSRFPHVRSDAYFPQQESSGYNVPMNSPWQKRDEQVSNYQRRGSMVSNLAAFNNSTVVDDFFCSQRNEINVNEEIGSLTSLNSPRWSQPRPQLSYENFMQYGVPLSSGRAKVPSNNRIRHGGIEGLTSDDSFIIQGEGVNYVINKGLDYSRSKAALNEIGMNKRLERKSQLNRSPQMVGVCGNARATKLCSPFCQPPKYNSLAEAHGCIYLTAMDQNGCRFLQRMFDEGTPEDVQIIFNEIIDHVVELMINPFGNYLMQKLLEVCTEEQRTRIVLVVTKQPGQLVQISLNTHGTRVVQKLIETLKTRQQTALVISALEPGFLSLIKDLNGNHVIQRCLQSLTSEENKFIFVAAAKYCVDIATHQHGCCALQRCISHSNGEYRRNLVSEISTNGLLLAQDAYGNYVVQFILELQIPSAMSNLISQFEGNYVHLSTQKFSSHVVEKCLLVFNADMQARILYEMLSASHFEQLLQHPHANYVIQTALKVSKGSLHDTLVKAIEAHKSASRNSPYSKRIFSQKILKKCDQTMRK